MLPRKCEVGMTSGVYGKPQRANFMMQEEQIRMNTVEGEKEAANRESKEVLHQQEEDADQEIEAMRDK